MVLMSSRMCLVDVLGGLQWGKGRVRSATSQIVTLALGEGAVTESLAGGPEFSQPPESVGVPADTSALGLRAGSNSRASRWQPPDSLLVRSG